MTMMTWPDTCPLIPCIPWACQLHSERIFNEVPKIIRCSLLLLPLQLSGSLPGERHLSQALLLFHYSQKPVYSLPNSNDTSDNNNENHPSHTFTPALVQPCPPCAAPKHQSQKQPSSTQNRSRKQRGIPPSEHQVSPCRYKLNSALW